jgi:transposase
MAETDLLLAPPAPNCKEINSAGLTRKLLKARGRQRTDSTHVLAAIQVLNRLECVGEALRQALNRVAALAPDWLQRWVPAEWFDRYSRRFEEYRLPPEKADRYALAEQIGTDGRLFLLTLADPAIVSSAA